MGFLQSQTPPLRYLKTKVISDCTDFLVEGARQTYQGTNVSDVEVLVWTGAIEPAATAATEKRVVDSLAKLGYGYTVIGAQASAGHTESFFIAESEKPDRVIGCWQTTPSGLYLNWGRLPTVTKVQQAPAQPGKYVQGWIASSGVGYGGGLVSTFFWLRKDGRFYSGSPNGATTDAHFAALQKSEAAHCGTYGIVGGEITLQLNGGKPEALKWGGGIMGKGVLRGVSYFAAADKLDGTWEAGVSIGTGSSSVVNLSSWIFHPDGTFDSGSVVIVGAGKRNESGNADAGKGSYEFIGHRIRLKFPDGSVKAVDVFHTDEKPKPYLIGIDGIVFQNVK